MSALMADLRHGARALLKQSGFTSMVVLTLAIGIGACTAIFTVVHAVLLRSLPFPDPGRIVCLNEIDGKGARMRVPEANFLTWREEATSFDAIAAYNSNVVTVTGHSEPERVRVSMVSRDFFDVLGTKPRIGRAFLPEELEEGAPAAAIVSHRYWRDILGAPTDLSGSKLLIGGNDTSVVGVMPDGFELPERTELWMPMEAAGPVNPSRSAHNWRIIGRLRPDTTIERATAELSAIAGRIHEQYDDVTAVSAEAIFLQRYMTSGVRTPLLVLSGAVAILLLVACANVMNLFLARATTRQREIAIRAALGASRWRLIQPMLAESLLVTLVGAATGIALSAIGIDALLKLGPSLPRADGIGIDPVVVAFSVGLSLMVALTVGILPGLRVGRDTASSLKNGVRGQVADRKGHLRKLLVVVQVGLTLVLLVGAGLLGNSFWRLLKVDLGFETSGRLVAMTSLPPANDETATAQRVDVLRRIQEGLAHLPGVERTGGITAMPLSRWGANGRFLIEGGGDSGSFWPSYSAATPGYFETLGIPLIDGRAFDERDVAGAPQVAVISRKVAETVWPEGGAIGKRINTGNMDGDQEYTTIVGIVDDVRERGPDDEVKGIVYVSAFQRPAAAGMFMSVIETRGSPEDLVADVRNLIRSVDPQMPVEFHTMNELYRSSLSSRTFDLTLLLVFGSTALALALLGIYGVMSYTVARRIPEIGIRMALGADTSHVVALFLREGGRLVLLGTIGGLVLTLASSRVLSSLLFEIDAMDALTYAGVVVPMFAVTLLACWIPARRGTRVDPMVALRDEN